MQQYIARRLLYGLLTAVLVSLLVFALMRIAPGDVAQMIAIEQSGGDASAIMMSNWQPSERPWA